MAVLRREMVWICSENGRGKTPKTGYEMEPPGRRKRGRPKLTWAEGIPGLLGLGGD